MVQIDILWNVYWDPIVLTKLVNREFGFANNNITF